jgi:hypothetical protein
MPMHIRLPFALSLVCAAGFALSWSATAAETELRFARGKTSKTISGIWRGNNDTYVFTARKGQTLRLQLNDGKRGSGHLDATLYAYCGEETGNPIASNVVRNKLVLPCNGRYSLDIAARTDIAIKQDEETYTLTVVIR